MTEVYHQSNKMDWETPQQLFETFHNVFNFTVDAAASAENAKLPRFWDKAQDALSTNWYGHNVWLNPPYGRTELPLFAKKAAHAARLGNTMVAMLVPARTDTRWWHTWVLPYARTIVCLRGRVTFVGATSGAPFPSVVVLYGDSVKPLGMVSLQQFLEQQ